MKKDYSVDEMKKIMGKDMEVPKSVDEGMKKAYEQLGIQKPCRILAHRCPDSQAHWNS